MVSSSALQGIEAPTQAVGNFLAAFVGRRPVFSQGRQVGYFTGDADLCSGKIVVTSTPAGDPATWTTKDDFWRDVSVTQFCLGRARKPTWATETEIAQYKPTVTGAMVPKTPADYMPWIIAGGVGVVALVLILRR